MCMMYCCINSSNSTPNMWKLIWSNKFVNFQFHDSQYGKRSSLSHLWFQYWWTQNLKNCVGFSAVRVVAFWGLIFCPPLRVSFSSSFSLGVFFILFPFNLSACGWVLRRPSYILIIIKMKAFYLTWYWIWT